MLGSLLTGVGSVLGGLLGGSESSKGKKKSVTRSKSTTKHTVRLGQLVKQAERAGFNPLTVLNAGGLAAYTKTQTSGLSKTKEKFSGTSSSSSPGAAVAGALNAVGGMMQTDGNALSENAAGAWQAPTGQPAGADELALVNAQLSSAEPILRPPVSSTYSATPVLAKDAEPGEWKRPVEQATEATNPYPPGYHIDPNVANASNWGDRLGEPGEWIGGVYVMAKDADYNNLKRSTPGLVDRTIQQKWQDAKETAKKAVEPYWSQSARDGASTAFATNASNLWDPPSISLFVDPVVKNQARPPLGYTAKPPDGGGGW